MNKILISVYHTCIPGMNTSGLNDPSAGIFAVEATCFQVFAMYEVAKAFPRTIRFMMDTETLSNLFTDSGCASLLENGLFFKADKAAMLKERAHPITFKELSDILFANMVK